MKINICPSSILRRTFVRQLTEDDCGQACLAMILRYTGEMEKASHLLSIPLTGNQSLKSLKLLMTSFGYTCDCVTMDMQYLLQIGEPCILHTEDALGNKHYQVCYGVKKTMRGTRFLLADPANQFYLIRPEDLNKIWKSKAALYVKGLKEDLEAFKDSPWTLLITSAKIPTVVWIVMPVLTMVNVVSGVALSFLIQRGFIYSNIFNSIHLIISLVSLLLVISVFKSGFSYLRQIILLKINRGVRQHFFRNLLKQVAAKRAINAHSNEDWAKRSLSEISLIQNAITILLATLASEGSLLMILLTAVCYTLPAAGIALAGFLLFIIFSTLTSSSQLLYANATIRQKSMVVERNLAKALHFEDSGFQMISQSESQHASAAERQALILTRKGLLQEIIGALTVVIILGITSYRLFAMQLSYPTLMFVVAISYIAVSIGTRLFSSFLSFAEGADVFLQFSLRNRN